MQITYPKRKSHKVWLFSDTEHEKKTRVICTNCVLSHILVTPVVLSILKHSDNSCSWLSTIYKLIRTAWPSTLLVVFVVVFSEKQKHLVFFIILNKDFYSKEYLLAHTENTSFCPLQWSHSVQDHSSKEHRHELHQTNDKTQVHNCN